MKNKKSYYVWIEKVSYGAVVVEAKNPEEAYAYIQNKCKVIEPFRETYTGSKVVKIEDMNGNTRYYSQYWEENSDVNPTFATSKKEKELLKKL